MLDSGLIVNKLLVFEGLPGCPGMHRDDWLGPIGK